MSDTIHLTIDGPRATITLHNPAVHNRLSPDDIVAFVGHLDTVERASDLRVLVITGAGEKTFCSGFDLGALAKRGTQAAESEATAPKDAPRRQRASRVRASG